MSVLEEFDHFWLSEWYQATLERVLFPCKQEKDIKEWEKKVCLHFLKDTSAVRKQGTSVIRNDRHSSEVQVALADKYLDRIGRDHNAFRDDEKALAICSKLWVALSNNETVAHEDVDRAGNTTSARVSGHSWYYI